MKDINKLAILVVLFSLFHLPLVAQTYHIQKYSIEEGLSHSFITSIIQDKDGFIWIGSRGGVSRFDGYTFINYFENDNLGRNWVWKCIQSNDGALWFGTQNGGLLQFKDDEWITFSTSDGLPSDMIRSIYEDSRGQLWIGTTQGFAIKNGSAWSSYSEADGLSDNLVYDFEEDDNQRMWIATDNGLSLFDGDSFTVFKTDNDLSHNTVQNIYKDQNGLLWFSTDQGVTTYDGHVMSKVDFGYNLTRNRTIVQDSSGNYWIATRDGLALYNGKTTKLLTVENGLSGAFSTTLIVDREGNLWIGGRAGINMLPPETGITSYNEKNGLDSDWVTSAIELDDGTMLVGTTESLNEIDVLTGEVSKSKMTHDPKHIRSLYKSSDGTIWIGLNNGLIWYKNGRKMVYKDEDPQVNVVHDIAESQDSTIWLATRGGVLKYDSRSFTRYRIADGLSSEIVRSILLDQNGVVWCGTREGISRFENGEWSVLTTGDGLAGNDVFALFEDNRANLWIGTRSGLSRISKGKITNFTVNDGLSNNNVTGILESGGNLYFATNNGLNEYNGSIFIEYNKSNGLPTSILHAGGAFKSSNGMLWFPSNHGIIRIDPNKLGHSAASPEIFITNLEINHEPYPISDAVDLTYKENDVRIEFTGLSFRAPKSMRYKYKLHGIDEPWIFTKDRIVDFEYLPSGNYRFEVFAYNENGIESSVPAELSFSINPPFWGTNSFRIISLFVLALFVYLRVMELKKHNVKLGKKVQESEGRIEKLEILLPICCNCKKIKKEDFSKDSTEWYSMEEYFSKEPDMNVTHGICPDCRDKLYPDLK